MAEPSGWYADPSGRHTYRYWGGSAWSNQVSDGGTAGVDPIDLDEATTSTPPAPGTQAPGMHAADGPPAPSVEVSQRSGGPGAGILGVLIGAIIVIVILFVWFNDADEDGTTPPTDLPAVTVTSPGPAPTDAPATTTP
jgi:hypothetical protein